MKVVNYGVEYVELEKVEEEQCLRVIEEALCQQIDSYSSVKDIPIEEVKNAISNVLDTYGCGIIANTDSLHKS